MESAYIDPFIRATREVIETMAMVAVVPEEPYTLPDRKTFGELTGEINLSGANVAGAMSISFEEPCILSIVNSMLGESFREISPEVTDAVGEITNMISSGAKKDLAEAGLKIDMAVPSLIHGAGLPLWNNSGITEVIILPFSVEFGKFEIAVWIEKSKK
jgi:chemotaxis protein CheX